MAAYYYTAFSIDGSKKKGVVEADSEKSARAKIRELKLTPIALKLSAEKKSTGFFSKLSPTRSLSITELSQATRQLGTLIQAGIPIDESLLACAENTDSQKVKSIFHDVRSNVMEGSSLASSLSALGKTFPRIFTATIAAGEKSGSLGAILARLADYSEAAAEFRQKIKSAMIYPTALVIIAIVIVTGLMTYVVPDILSVFIEAGQALPPITQGLMNVSQFIANNGLWILIVALLALLIVSYLLSNETIKFKIDKTFSNLLFIKKYVRSYNAIRYFGTLNILFSSGVPLTEAMRIASNVVENRHIRQQLLLASTKVEEGSSLHLALKPIKELPSLFVHMIRSGEASGTLDSMISKVVYSQEQELQRRVATLLSLFEPATLIIMGGVVMLIVLAILLPIMNMNQLII